MSVLVSRWVLWVALMILVPLPMWVQSHWVWVPAFRVIQLAWRSLVFSAVDGVISVVLLTQMGVGALLLAGLAFAYGSLARAWPVKIRGSIMSLTVFVALILMASIPVYKPIVAGQAGQMVSFMSVYD